MQTSVELQVAIMLHRPVTGEDVRCLVLCFGFSKGVIYTFTDRSLKAFFETFHLFSEKSAVCWPQENELEEIPQGFILLTPPSASTRFTKCIGAIDGMLIEIIPPSESPDTFHC